MFAADDSGITPIEFLLVGLAGCLTAGVASVAQNRGIQFRVPDPAERGKIVTALSNASQSLGASLTGAVQDYTVTDGGDGLVQVQLTDAGIDNKIHRAVDQSIEVLRRRHAEQGEHRAAARGLAGDRHP